MEYDRILGDALRLTWRFKFLWVFALLGGGSYSSCGGSPNLNYNIGRPLGAGSSAVPEELRPLIEAMRDFPGFVGSHFGELLLVLGALVGIGLVFFILSFIARGALISSIERLSRGENADFSSGWRTGIELGWRYFGLWLLVIMLVLGFLLANALVAGAVILFAQGGDTARMVAIIVGVLLALAAMAGMIVFIIAMSIINEFGERAIAIDDLGPAAALRQGYELLMQHLWQSALIWLISVAVAIAAGIALAIPALIIGVPLGALVFGAYAASGVSGTTIAAAATAAVIWIAVMWVLGSIAGAYGSAYWTLSYLMISGRYPPPVSAAEPTTLN